MTTAAIQVRGIRKSFKDLEVLRGVDFDVRMTHTSRSA